MSDWDGARDVVRDEVRLQEGAQTVLRWSDGREDPVGQIDERGPEIWKMDWGLEPGAKVPGARCQLLAGYQVGRRGLLGRSSACWSTRGEGEGVGVGVTVMTATLPRWIPSFGNAGCTGQVRLAITRLMLEDGMGLGSRSSHGMVGGWSRGAPRSMGSKRSHDRAGRATHRVG
jgi:hypothetical protein